MARQGLLPEGFVRSGERSDFQPVYSTANMDPHDLNLSSISSSTVYSNQGNQGFIQPGFSSISSLGFQQVQPQPIFTTLAQQQHQLQQQQIHQQQIQQQQQIQHQLMQQLQNPSSNSGFMPPNQMNPEVGFLITSPLLHQLEFPVGNSKYFKTSLFL